MGGVFFFTDLTTSSSLEDGVVITINIDKSSSVLCMFIGDFLIS